MRHLEPDNKHKLSLLLVVLSLTRWMARESERKRVEKSYYKIHSLNKEKKKYVSNPQVVVQFHAISFCLQDRLLWQFPLEQNHFQTEGGWDGPGAHTPLWHWKTLDSTVSTFAGLFPLLQGERFQMCSIASKYATLSWSEIMISRDFVCMCACMRVYARTQTCVSIYECCYSTTCWLTGTAEKMNTPLLF